MHAPLKYLKDIILQFPELCHGDEVLVTLNDHRKQELASILLDEESGKTDPFKASMALVLASKLGLVGVY